MKGKRLKGILALAMAFTVAFSSLSTVIARAEGNNNISGKTINELLEKLPENYKNYLEVSTNKIKVGDEVDLKSSEPVEIIVELSSDPLSVQRGKKAATYGISDINAEHELFKNSFVQAYSNEESNIEFGLEFTEVFNGITMTVPANEIQTIAEMDIVKTIWSNRIVQLELPEDPDYTQDSGDISLLMHDSIPEIGVDKLHEEDIKGNGIKIGVLDTGVDYNHPDLASAYKGGYDFIDDDNDPMETTYEDWKSSGYPETNENGTEYYTSHGTHVAGTILGRGENEGLDYAITGVAPQADLYAYRVLGSYGSGSIDGIIAGIEQAVRDGMDVINLSLGVSVNDALRPEAVAINNCMLYTDTVAVVAAGNSGSNSFTMSSPGTAALAITVGANNVSIGIDSIDVIAGENSYTLEEVAKNWGETAEELVGNEFEVVDIGLGSVGEIDGRDLTGKIALIQRGTLYFVEKIENAKAAGAEAIIMYNNVTGPLNVYLGEAGSYIKTYGMSMEDGLALKELIAEQDEEFKISFDNYNKVYSEGGILADFSSRGPVTTTLDIKPEVTAPGVNVLSTVPGFINDQENYDNYDISYGRMSGTSMAAPHVAGVVALIKEENPDYSPADVKTALMNNAVALSEDYSVFEVGAGMVNAYNAVKSDVKIQVMDVATSLNENDEYVEIPDVTGDLSFGRIERCTTVNKLINIELNSAEDKEFSVRTEFTSSNHMPVSSDAAEAIQFNVPESIYLFAGYTSEVNVSMNIPEGAPNGTYEGYVILSCGEEEYRIPFAANVSEKYVAVENDSKAISLGEFHPYQSAYSINSIFEVSDKFDQLDILILDGETNEYVGYGGSLAVDNIPVNTALFLQGIVYLGYYTPILKDADGFYYIDPTSYKLVEDKRYIVQFHAVDKNGEVIIGEDDFFVDSVAPKIIYDEDTQPGVYEVEYDPNNPDEIVWINGYVQDDFIDYANQYGLDITQADNWIAYHEKNDIYWNQGGLELGEGGRIHVGYPTSEIEETGITRLSLYAVDYASTSNYRTGVETFVFVKKGEPYIEVNGQYRDLKVGDSFTLTMDGKYLDDFTFGSFDAVTFTSENEELIYDITDIKPTAELEAFLAENNMSIDIQYSETEIGIGDAITKVQCELKGDNIVGISGDMPLLEVEFEVKNEMKLTMGQILKVGTYKNYRTDDNFNYTKTNGEEVNIEVFNVNKGIVDCESSVAVSSMVPQGATDENGYLSKNLADIGATVVVTTPDGNKYNGIVDYEYMGYYALKDIPAMDGVYKIEASAPGHLSSVLESKMAYNYDGKMYGGDIMPFGTALKAGDVNGDGVIDIRDAILIARAVGKDVPEVDGINRDLNFDGLIGKTDLDYVVENFGYVCGLKDDISSVMTEFDGMTLDDVIEKAGKLHEDKAPEIAINLEDGKVYNSQVNIEVTTEDYIYSTYKLYVNGEEFNGSSLYEDGKYEIEVVATDDLGNTSTKKVNIKIKTTGPKVEVAGVEDGKIYEEAVKPVITTEEGTENTITLNGNAYDGEEIAEEGKYTLIVESKDEAGNVTKVTINFEIVKKAIDPTPGDGNGNGSDEESNNGNSGNSGSGNGSVDSKPNEDNSSKPGNNLPNTGAVIGSVAIIIGALAIVVIGVILLRRKKEK